MRPILPQKVRARFRVRFTVGSSQSLLDSIRPRYLKSGTILMVAPYTVKDCLSYSLLVCQFGLTLLMDRRPSFASGYFLVALTDSRLEIFALPAAWEWGFFLDNDRFFASACFESVVAFVYDGRCCRPPRYTAGRFSFRFSWLVT
jgi:hypothetical protein